ncbi:hybrid sensor histidine kinase/response regulator [Hyphomicrobium sp. D-2]|uniref:hybrid sensor histidine kinase/response regulator n=1 Tax=Hyphomicrobium sp. D-2 TaxID=3041621 RepID=UPI0024584DB1|nr:hybrid sensor histidine kinase/response regulator [Hyphomicrobium sp. D-2]MDH4982314.1 hybrid sensor histidine kinase/response regulator [Hyphomicrobium sp. D-2]
MASLFENDPHGSNPHDLERRIVKLQKINAALIERVERSMDQQGSAYSLFQTAIALESQVRLRTEELTSTLARLERTNDELSAARDASEQANRFKTRFFTAVGHDLLQPLHAARLSASALAEAESSPAQRVIAERIEHALTTIEQLLKSILDISKLEAGVITPALRPVALDEVFAALCVDLDPQAKAKGLSLSYRPCDLNVVSDPLMLRRIVQNLTANAVQYTAKGRVRLLARRRGGQVRIEVWDTGPGIGEADRKTIFEEFQRGSATDRPSIGGFGLGLSIVQRMAEALGHQLELCSRVGHGTRFSVSAPYVNRPMLAAHSSSAAVNASNTAVALGGAELVGAKVAVIDNDPGVLEAMHALVERWGCEVISARSLVELQKASAPHRHDIILADYHLDDQRTGLDAVRALRAASGREIPAIVITADHTEGIANAARSFNCELMLKPAKPAKLRALMVHLLSGASHFNIS